MPNDAIHRDTLWLMIFHHHIKPSQKPPVPSQNHQTANEVKPHFLGKICDLKVLEFDSHYRRKSHHCEKKQVKPV